MYSGSSLGRFTEVRWSQEVISFVIQKCIHELDRQYLG